VDRVVTDPPWGKYDAQLADIAMLYDGTLREVARILKRDGVAVIVSAYEAMPEHIEKVTTLRNISQWNILVSGKKATIYKLQKI
jgi:tRNA G10  N-methylase Trm11